MSSLFGALDASATTLDAYTQALNVVQNNVGNASTQGYAAQSAIFTPLPFDAFAGEGGGVTYSGTQSLRNEPSERNLQTQNSELGSANSLVSSLSNLQTSFDVTGSTGLSAALPAFFTSFAALSQNPSDEVARQQVIAASQNVAAAFNSTAQAVSDASNSATQQIQTTVSDINNLASQISQLNQQQMNNPSPDPNTDASIHADLQNLSSLTNITYSVAQNGSVNVLIGGQTPLVTGATAYSISAASAPVSATAPQPGGVPSEIIQDRNGTDITSQITGGSLAGTLQFRNQTVPGLIGDTQQTGSLNQLAQSFADRVNTLLTGGQISSGPPAVAGQALFQYSSQNPGTIAQTLSVTGITGDQIATIDPGPPSTANGIAQQISNLSTSSAAADQINGLTFPGDYGQIAAGVGQQLSNAANTQTQQSQAVAQAQNMLNQVSGVSLDAEAVQLTDFQKSYEATAKMVTILSDLTETAINLIPN